MSLPIHAVRALILLTCVACASVPELPSGEMVGEPIEVQEVIPLSKVHANPSAYFERTLLVEATAAAVCQSAGCWMQIEDDDSRAMVRWESGCGGKYAFPSDVAGRRILIQGSFYPTEISEEDVAHLESEAPEGTTIDEKGYEMNASAVLVIGEPTQDA